MIGWLRSWLYPLLGGVACGNAVGSALSGHFGVSIVSIAEAAVLFTLSRWREERLEAEKKK